MIASGIRKKHIALLALFVVTFFISLTALANPEAGEFTAHYESSKSFVTGLTVVSLKKTENYYLYESLTTVTGFMSLFSDNKILERSRWVFNDRTIRPISYSYERTGSRERNVELNFDWNKNSVTNTINSDPWRMDIQPDTLDKFVYQLAMMKDLRTLPDDTRELVYSIADGGKLKTYTLTLHGKETIKTELGELETIKVSRSNGKRTTTLWCAEKLAYLPVRINQKKKGGSEYTANITKLEGTPGFR